MVDLKYIKGKRLIDFLNSENYEFDILYSVEFVYVSEELSDKGFYLYFSIDGYYNLIRSNYVSIDKNGEVYCSLNDPYDSSSEYEEIEEATKLYLNNLEIDIRDNKLSEVIDSEEEIINRYKSTILSKLNSISDLVNKCNDINTLKDIDDKLIEI
jgi:hypothetical protein